MTPQRSIHSHFTAIAILLILCNSIIYTADIPWLHFLMSFLRIIAVGYALALVLSNAAVGKFTYLVVLFYVFLGYTTFIHQGALNLWATNFLNTLGLSILLYYSLRRSVKYTVSILASIFAILIYLNFITFLIWPNGVLQGAYILGRNYNQMGASLVCGIVTYCIAYDMNLRSRWSTILLCSVCVITPLLFGSMTSTAGCLIASGFMFIPTQRIRRYAIIFFFAFYLIFQALVVFLQHDISNEKSAVFLVEEVMGKDLTFTKRTVVWSLSYNMAQDSPMTGYGMRDGQWFAEHLHVLSTHNIILQMLIYGGRILLIAFLFDIVISVMHSFTHKSRATETALFGLCTFFFMMMMENYNILLIFYMLMLVFYAPRFASSIQTTNPIERRETSDGNSTNTL